MELFYGFYAETLDFLKDSLSALAWPSLVAFFLWRFEDELKDALMRLKLSYKDFTLSIEQQLAKLAENAGVDINKPSAVEPKKTTPIEKIQQAEGVLEKAPRVAMEVARIALEQAIRESTSGKGKVGAPTLPEAVNILRNFGVINEDEEKLIKFLCRIDEKLAHFSIRETWNKSSGAQQYLAATRAIIEKLNQPVL